MGNLVFGSIHGGAMDLSTKALVQPNITGRIPAESSKISDWGHIKDLMLADPYFLTPGQIDVLLGADIYSQIVLEGLRKGPIGSPMAQSTILGWVISGRSVESVNAIPTPTTISSYVPLTNGDALLQKFWEIEEKPTTRIVSKEENDCEKLFESTHSRTSDGRYLVRLPFKRNDDGALNLGRSRSIDVANMLQLEKRFTRDARLKQKYVECVEEYSSLGHMEPTSSTEQAICNSYSSCYLPHHTVLKESSTTTKLRMLFNASRKTTSGVSLNDALMVGPTIQQGLWSIVIRWRRHQIALTADVEKMYRQVAVEKQDSEYQGIVWRNRSTEPMTYILEYIT